MTLTEIILGVGITVAGLFLSLIAIWIISNLQDYES